MMRHDARFWVIIPAAGAGERFGNSVPKQYYPLLGQSVIEHAIAPFLSQESVEKILVVLSNTDQFWSGLKIASHGTIESVIGGQTRAESVLSGLNAIQHRAKAYDWVLVHDAARPCLAAGDLKRLIEQLTDQPVGGILAAPVSDTLKRVSDSELAIEKTVPRQGLWRALTPQLFRFGILHRAIQHAIDQNESITDEAQAVELINEQVCLVEGSPLNVKLTHSNDLPLIKAVLELMA